MRSTSEDVRAWCDRTWPAVYRHIYRLVQNREEAEDLTQDTYTRVVKRGFSNDGPPHLGYLIAAATNAVRDSWRRSRRSGPCRRWSRVDCMIEDMRCERRPGVPKDREEAELMAVARLVRTSRAQREAPAGLGDRLAGALPAARPSRAVRLRGLRPGQVAVLGIAAALVLFLGFSMASGLWNRDIAYAMSKAVDRILSYHGVLEKSYRTESGESQVVRSAEVWSWGDGYATELEDGTLTVNDGNAKWQVRLVDRTVALLPAVPDPDRSGLDLRTEAERALAYPHVEGGEDVVLGRPAIRLEVTPPGGQTYEIWIDRETRLPLRLRTAMQNGIQTTYTYTEFEVGGVDPADFAYAVPEGYAVVDEDPGQVVATPAEAAGIAGFSPVMPDGRPSRIVAHASGRIVLVYDDSTVVQIPGQGEFSPAPGAAVGTFRSRSTPDTARGKSTRSRYL